MMKFTKYEEARIIGARALQIAMGAPILIDLTAEKLAALMHSPIAIAKTEFNNGVLPITIKRPLPAKLSS